VNSTISWTIDETERNFQSLRRLAGGHTPTGRLGDGHPQGIMRRSERDITLSTHHEIHLLLR
jgi:hypothetical protein